MLKKIAALTLLLSVLLPVNVFAEEIPTAEGHDYQNGLLDDDNIEVNNLPRGLYDNDLNNEGALESEVDYNVKFKESVDTEAIYIHDSFPTAIKLIFSNGESTKLNDVRENKFDENLYELEYKDVEEIIFNNPMSVEATLWEIDFFGSYNDDEIGNGDTEPPTNITDLTESVSAGSVGFNYNLPTDDDFNHINVYTNGETYETTESSFTLDGLEPETEYEVTFKSVDETGNESDGVTKTITTAVPEPEAPEDLPEVNNLQIEPEPDKVTLQWENPNTDFYDMTKIYRKEAGSASASAWNLIAPQKVSAAETYEPLFETNGTEFIDHSVQDNTDYDYKVTTTYGDLESDGVTSTTTVPEAPPVDLGGLDLPFGIDALIKSGNGLLGLAGSFVLLGLAFILVPKLIRLIRQSFGNGQAGSTATAAAGTGTQKEIKQARLTERQQKKLMKQQQKQQVKATRETRQAKETRVQREPRTGRG